MKKTFLLVLSALFLVLVGAAGYIFAVRKMDRDAAQDTALYRPKESMAASRRLPAAFIDDRVYLQVVDRNGDTILGLGDTGGGVSMVMPHDRMPRILTENTRLGMLKGMMPMRYVLYSDIAADNTQPAPMPIRDRLVHTPFALLREPALLIPPDDEEMRLFRRTMKADIFLGQNFFMGRAWTLDYLHHELYVNTPVTTSGPDVQPVGFARDANGEAVYGHPSMTMIVDGDTIPVLFDTGASIVLSDTGHQLLHTERPTMAGSFIARSVLAQWHQKHPEWAYYPQADLAGDVIIVPSVHLCGHDTGPVAFAGREDAVWSMGMISSMDRVVKGAIGGSALRYFRVTIDYPHALVRMEQ